MYNSEQTIALQKNTTDWLSALKTENLLETIKNKSEDLRNVLRFHEYR